jgi:hypothetical protein
MSYHKCELQSEGRLMSKQTSPTPLHPIPPLHFWETTWLSYEETRRAHKLFRTQSKGRRAIFIHKKCNLILGEGGGIFCVSFRGGAII